jgi:hypothetical protein
MLTLSGTSSARTLDVQASKHNPRRLNLNETIIRAVPPSIKYAAKPPPDWRIEIHFTADRIAARQRL